MILLNHVIQVLVGPDERLSGQDAFGLQFGYGLMRRLTAVEGDLLRNLIITDCLLEEAYGGRFISILTEQEIYGLTLLIDRAIEISPSDLQFDIGFTDSPKLSGLHQNPESRSISKMVASWLRAKPFSLSRMA